MKINLVVLSQEERERINVDFAAASVAFKERYKIPVIVEEIEQEQPIYLRKWFRERLIIHRLNSADFLRFSRKFRSRKK